MNSKRGVRSLWDYLILEHVNCQAIIIRHLARGETPPGCFSYIISILPYQIPTYQAKAKPSLQLELSKNGLSLRGICNALSLK